MKQISLLAVALFVATSCAVKKDETKSSSNISSEVVANLNKISANYSPDSMAPKTSFSSDPCAGVSDFAVCQSNLIREYLKIGKAQVDALSKIASDVGTALGQVPDGNSGTSTDGKVSWNKTSATVWSILVRGTASAPNAYFSINGGTYTLKFNKAVSETSPDSSQIETTVNYTDENTWNVDVFFSKTECNADDVGAPSKAQIKLAYADGLWKGKSMLYAPRFEAPQINVDCNTSAGTHEVGMYTDFVGNDTSTKAALYLIPGNNSNLSSISSFAIPQFCTNFASYCGGMGQPTAGALASYQNNWCTTGPNTSPTWNNNCPSNTAVSGATYSDASNWIVPNTLKSKTVTVPASL